MDYDYRNRTGPVNRPAPASSFYPRISPQPGQQVPVPAGRATYPHPAAAPLSGSGTIRVMLKPEYRITPPPQLAPQVTEVPRSHFSFDFDFERRILAEAEKGSQNWSRIVPENQPNFSASASSAAPAGDPAVEKYVAMGLGREAATLAVANFGDDAIKVREFVKGYNLLREMGFASKNVAEALAMYDNDTDQALAHFLNSSS
ncbi:unnamed protein product [Spirodela intermedia]|uniref:Uncharacterized protein n=1 Tax=Spirodela intermedia TaxID=51605 RepID=A0A7I8L0D7_SPIIN|nr:unnamed protein product [Spirodela intermedia]